MSIEYTYEITSTDEAARVMEVTYSSPGRQTMFVCARLPYQGEPVEAVIEMFSPVPFWIAQETPVVVPATGTSGTIVVAPPAPPPDSSAQGQPIAVGAQTL